MDHEPVERGIDTTVDAFRRILSAYELALTSGTKQVDADQRREVAQTEEALEAFRERLQECAEELQDAVDQCRTPHALPLHKVDPNKEQAKLLVAYAHKLSFTTFAPPGFIPGATPLRNYRPPAPQDWQLRCSLLHNFAAEYAARYPTPISASPADATAPSLLLPDDMDLGSLPPMPPGWKPGDPIPGFDFPESLQQQHQGDVGLSDTAPQQQQMEPQPQLPAAPVFGGLDLGIVLNPDLELEPAEEEYSSYSEEYSDDDV